MAVCAQHTEAGLGGCVSGTQVSGGEWARFQSADRSSVGGQSSPSPPELLQSLLVSASVLSHQPNNCHRGLFQNLLCYSPT